MFIYYLKSLSITSDPYITICKCESKISPLSWTLRCWMKEEMNGKFVAFACYQHGK